MPKISFYEVYVAIFLVGMSVFWFKYGTWTDLITLIEYEPLLLVVAVLVAVIVIYEKIKWIYRKLSGGFKAK